MSFFAMLRRLSLIQRWSLMRNTSPENVMEHSYQAAYLAHALALIRREIYPELQPQVDPERVLALALYHDATEIITGDMPTPIKYATQALRQAYAAEEDRARQRLLAMLPSRLREAYRPYLSEAPETAQEELEHKLVKAADQLSAYIKCQEEVGRGNREFSQALDQTRAKLEACQLPELDYFCREILPSFSLSLDQLQSMEPLEQGPQDPESGFLHAD